MGSNVSSILGGASLLAHNRRSVLWSDGNERRGGQAKRYRVYCKGCDALHHRSALLQRGAIFSTRGASAGVYGLCGIYKRDLDACCADAVVTWVVKLGLKDDEDGREAVVIAVRDLLQLGLV